MYFSNSATESEFFRSLFSRAEKRSKTTGFSPSGTGYETAP
jgi:hypothetical protein